MPPASDINLTPKTSPLSVVKLNYLSNSPESASKILTPTPAQLQSALSPDLNINLSPCSSPRLSKTAQNWNSFNKFFKKVLIGRFSKFTCTSVSWKRIPGSSWSKTLARSSPPKTQPVTSTFFTRPNASKSSQKTCIQSVLTKINPLLFAILVTYLTWYLYLSRTN